MNACIHYGECKKPAGSSEPSFYASIPLKAKSLKKWREISWGKNYIDPELNWKQMFFAYFNKKI